MGSKAEFLKALYMLAEAYGKELTPGRAEVYLAMLYEHFKPVPRDQFLKTCLNNFEFFPTVKQVLDLWVGDPKERAEALVDKIIMAFTTQTGKGIDYCGLSSAEYNFAKHTLGVLPRDIASGQCDPKYLRKTWVERTTRALGGEERQAQLESGGKVLRLLRPVKTLD